MSMVIRQQPIDVENYYIVDKSASYNLISNGFHPLYMWRDSYYYKKTKELQNFLRKGGEENY